MNHDLRFHRQVWTSAARLHQFVPVLHVLLSLLQKTSVLLRQQQRKQRIKHVSTIADQSDSCRMTQANPNRIQIDLYCLRLSRLWIKFQVWKTAAGNDQGVAFCQSLLRWGGAQQSHAAGGVGTVVWNHRLSEKRLD